MNHQNRTGQLILPPSSDAEILQLCGWAGEEAAEQYWGEHAEDHRNFQIVGSSYQSPPDKVELWKIFTAVTGQSPDLTPQPTGNCVAAAADDVIECTQCIEIDAGDAEDYKPIYNPYHYATGRVIIGKNRLRGGAGSLGGWQAKAIEEHGVIPVQEGLPKYNERNCDAWGDDREAEGKSFRDYLEQGAEHVIKSTAPVKSVQQVIDALANKYLLTIAANFGYDMKARGGEKGYHQRGRAWAHQMSLWGYCISEGWIAIKNQWGNVHGQLVDIATGEPWPLGFIRAPMNVFEQHLRQAECIAFSNFDGFPEQQYDFSRWAA